MIMGSYSKFQGDLKKGKIYEKKASEYFDYKKIHYPEGCFKDYDFIIDDKIKIEVKSDTSASRTGNLAIEYECNGKPSGISSTKADYYVYFINHPDHDEVYLIPIKDLVDICKSKGFKVSGGDGNRSRMYLVKKEFYKKYITKEKKHKPLDNEINEIEEPNYIMPFGKYKGMDLKEVYKKDKKYLLWLNGLEWFNNFKNLKNQIKTLEEN